MPSVSAARAKIRSLRRRGQAPGRREIRRSARRVRPWRGHGHRRFAAGEQHGRRVQRNAAVADGERGCGHGASDRRALRPRWRRRESRASTPAARADRPPRFEARHRRGDDRAVARTAQAAGRRASAFRPSPRRGARRPPVAARCRGARARRARRRRSCGSATVGPEAMTARVVAGHVGDEQRDDFAPAQAAAARRPPLMAERCFRTVFISPMVAPEASSARFTACLSASVKPVGGKRQQRRAAAGDEAEHEIVRPGALRQRRECAARRRARVRRARGAQLRRSRSRWQGTPWP